MTFPAFGKISRLRRPVTITEKIDGTNGLIEIISVGSFTPTELYNEEDGDLYVPTATETFVIRAGSRNRWLAPTKQGDNHGFAKWVHENAGTLVHLGPGNHYGEWFGAGIQRRYGLTEKYFALFNRTKYDDFVEAGHWLDTLTTVPVIAVGVFSDSLVETALDRLRLGGSLISASLGVETYQPAEGIIVQHSQNLVRFKVLIEGDDISKTEAWPKPLKIRVKNTGSAVSTDGGYANSGVVIGPTWRAAA